MIHSVRQMVTGCGTLPESMLREGGSPKAGFPIIFSFFLLETDDRRILVDTSCDTMPGMEIRNRRSPAEALQEEKVSPDTITDVLLTHAHHDHIEGVRFFPQARFFIQEDEYACGGRNYFPAGADVTCFRQEYSLGGVQMKRIGGHSVGSSIALFRYRNAPVSDRRGRMLRLRKYPGETAARQPLSPAGKPALFGNLCRRRMAHPAVPSAGRFPADGTEKQKRRALKERRVPACAKQGRFDGL